MKISTLKDILLPIGLIWTICPLLLVASFWMTDKFGPAGFIGALFCIGVLCLIALGGIKLWEKRTAKEGGKQKDSFTKS